MLFYSSLPCGSCHFGELRFIRKAQFEWYQLYESFPASTLNKGFLLWAPKHPVSTFADTCFVMLRLCVSVLSTFLNRNLFFSHLCIPSAQSLVMT